MTNFEKNKNLFIELLSSDLKTPCVEVWLARTNRKEVGCPQFICPNDESVCKECGRLNKEWLEKEATTFDLAELKVGDKIRMRKLEEKSAWMYEVVCNSFPALWLRFRASENKVPQAKDENFLISYDDFLDKYEIYEVFKNDMLYR